MRVLILKDVTNFPSSFLNNH